MVSFVSLGTLGAFMLSSFRKPKRWDRPSLFENVQVQRSNVNSELSSSWKRNPTQCECISRSIVASATLIFPPCHENPWSMGMAWEACENGGTTIGDYRGSVGKSLDFCVWSISNSVVYGLQMILLHPFQYQETATSKSRVADTKPRTKSSRDDLAEGLCIVVVWMAYRADVDEWRDGSHGNTCPLLGSWVEI